MNYYLVSDKIKYHASSSPQLNPVASMPPSPSPSQLQNGTL